MATRQSSSGNRLGGKRKISIVEDILLFEAQETPTWRRTKLPSVKEMLKEIVQNQQRWESSKNDYNKDVVVKVLDNFLIGFLFHVNYEEEHGYGTLEQTQMCLKKVYSDIKLKLRRALEEKETINLKKAYEYLTLEEKKESSLELAGLIEVSMLKEAHKRILDSIELPKGYTKPGAFSDKRRSRTFKGELYEYQNPPNMEEAVGTLLDRHNLLLESVKSEQNDVIRSYDLFKTCGVLLHELLDLHPFCDGNGRLCRLLCSYCLSVFTPFPTPIYNVWSDSSKDDYKQALVDARKTAGRHPKSLTTMIIECNWFGWKEFFKALDQEEQAQRSIKVP